MGCCVICFRVGGIDQSPNFNHGSDQTETSIDGKKEESENEQNKKLFHKFFKLLERHLNSDNNGFFNRVVVGQLINTDNVEVMKKSFFRYANSFTKLPACENCLTVLNSFCDLYHKIKHLELLLNWRMWTVMNLMFCAQLVPARVNCFRNSARNELEKAENPTRDPNKDAFGKEETIEAVLQYRKLLIKRCSQRFTSTYPKLVLKRTPQNDRAEEKCSKADETALPAVQELPNAEVPCSNEFETNGEDTLFRVSLFIRTDDDIDNYVETDGDEENDCDFPSPTKTESCSNEAKPTSALASPPSDSEHFGGNKILHSDDDDDDIHSEVVETLQLASGAVVSVESSSENAMNKTSFSRESKRTEAKDFFDTPTKTEVTNEVKIETCTPAAEELAISCNRTRRLLRTMHRCKTCQRTFSNLEKLTDHQNSKVCVGAADATFSDSENDLNSFDSADGGDDDEATFPPSLSHTKKVKRRRMLTNTTTPTKNRDDDEDDYDVSMNSDCDSPSSSSATKEVEVEDTGTDNDIIALLQPKDLHRAIDYCASSANRNSTKELSKHFRVVCPECGKLFLYFRKMLLHRKNAHHQSADSEVNQEKKDNVSFKTVYVEILRFPEGTKIRSFGNNKKLQSFELYAKIKIPFKIFSCPEENCRSKQIFFSQEDLQSHSKLHGHFQCQFCDFSVTYARLLSEHELNIHSRKDSSRGFSKFCARCDSHFKNKSSYLQHHVSAHLKLQNMEACCPICKISLPPNKLEKILHFKTHHDLQHLKNQEEEDEKLFKCSKKDNCSAYFRTSKQFREHFERFHISVEESERSKRELSYQKKEKLVRGKKRSKEIKARRQGTSVKCRFCSNYYPWESIKKHVAKFHPSYRRFQMKNSSYKKTRLIPLNCGICGKKTNREKLSEHMKKFHPETHQKMFEKKKKNKANSEEEDKTLNPDATQARMPAKSANGVRILCPEENCRKLFRNLHDMSLHRKDSHPHHEILSNKDTNNNKTISIELIRFSEEVTTIPDEMNSIKGQEISFKPFARIEIPSKILSCPEEECKQIFYNEEDFQTHSKLHGNFKCQFCDFVDNYALSLLEHELQQHSNSKDNNNGNGTKCPRCDYNSNTKRHYVLLEHHVSVHLKLRKMEQGCPICRLPITHRVKETGHELKHLASFHDLDLSNGNGNGKMKIHKCSEPNCLAYFLTLKQLLNHRNMVHGNITVTTRKCASSSSGEKFECKDCGKLLKTRRTLLVHRQKEHFAAMISCSVEGCLQYFDSQQEMELHLEVTHGNRNGISEKICTKCGRAINGSMGAFNMHMKMHERKEKIEKGEMQKPTFVCEQCGIKFKLKTALQNHLKNVHGGQANWDFACATCGKKSASKWSAKEHMRTHTSEKPFVCSVCGQAYSHRHNLRIHINSKHGDVMQDVPQKYDRINKRAKPPINANYGPRPKRKKTESGANPDSSGLDNVAAETVIS